jgi:hypothetical protein
MSYSAIARDDEGDGGSDIRIARSICASDGGNGASDEVADAAGRELICRGEKMGRDGEQRDGV